MYSGIFITDNRLKFSQELAEILRNNGFKSYLSSQPIVQSPENKELKPIGVIEWNRASLFSLESIPLKFKNMNLDLDTVIVVFDGEAYKNLYPANDLISIDNTITDLIFSYTSLCLLFKDYFIKKGAGRMIFVHRDVDIPCTNICVSSASASFMRLSEETASCIRKANLENPQNEKLQTLLVKLEGYDDESFAEWIYNQMHLSVLSKNPIRWIKAGQRKFF